MDYDQEHDEVIDLGVASVETKGIVGLSTDSDQHPAQNAGIAND